MYPERFAAARLDTDSDDLPTVAGCDAGQDKAPVGPDRHGAHLAAEIEDAGGHRGAGRDELESAALDGHDHERPVRGERHSACIPGQRNADGGGAVESGLQQQRPPARAGGHDGHEPSICGAAGAEGTGHAWERDLRDGHALRVGQRGKHTGHHRVHAVHFHEEQREQPPVPALELAGGTDDHGGVLAGERHDDASVGRGKGRQPWAGKGDPAHRDTPRGVEEDELPRFQRSGDRRRDEEADNHRRSVALD